MCNIINQLFACGHRQFQNIYRCHLVASSSLGSHPIPSQDDQDQNHRNQDSHSVGTIRPRVLPDKEAAWEVMMCERCPNLRRPSRPVAGSCRECLMLSQRRRLELQMVISHDRADAGPRSNPEPGGEDCGAQRIQAQTQTRPQHSIHQPQDLATSLVCQGQRPGQPQK